MFRNWLIRTIISIAAFTLIVAVFWGVQYRVNPHLLPSATSCLVQYGIGTLLCGVCTGVWLVRKKHIR